MNQNHVLDSSFSAQLLPVGLNVVIEDESDYVFVGGDDDIDIDVLVNEEVDHDDDDVDDDIDWDERSYDHCDLSPSLSCATSVATNVTLKDLNLDTGAAATTTTTTGDANIMTTTMVMDDPMDVDEDVNGDCGNWNSMLGRTSTSVIIADAEHYFAANPKSGRRLSNKKLRMKMKKLKKAAAARALAEQKAAAKSATTAVAVVSSMSSSSSSEDETKMMQQKKPRAVSIDCT